MRQHGANAQAVGAHLLAHPRGLRVHYPTLPGTPWEAAAQRLLPFPFRMLLGAPQQLFRPAFRLCICSCLRRIRGGFGLRLPSLFKLALRYFNLTLRCLFQLARGLAFRLPMGFRRPPPMMRPVLPNGRRKISILGSGQVRPRVQNSDILRRLRSQGLLFHPRVCVVHSSLHRPAGKASRSVPQAHNRSLGEGTTVHRQLCSTWV